jgi:hypothetical protein
MCDTYTWQRQTLFMRYKPTNSLQRLFHKDYERKDSVMKNKEGLWLWASRQTDWRWTASRKVTLNTYLKELYGIASWVAMPLVHCEDSRAQERGSLDCLLLKVKCRVIHVYARQGSCLCVLVTVCAARSTLTEEIGFQPLRIPTFTERTEERRAKESAGLARVMR